MRTKRDVLGDVFIQPEVQRLSPFFQNSRRIALSSGAFIGIEELKETRPTFIRFTFGNLRKNRILKKFKLDSGFTFDPAKFSEWFLMCVKIVTVAQTEGIRPKQSRQWLASQAKKQKFISTLSPEAARLVIRFNKKINHIQNSEGAGAPVRIGPFFMTENAGRTLLETMVTVADEIW